MFSVFHRVTQRRAERVWHRVEWLQNGFIGVLGVPRPPLVTFGAAALAEFALLPAAEFGLLLADPIFEVSVSKVFDLEPGRSIVIRLASPFSSLRFVGNSHRLVNLRFRSNFQLSLLKTRKAWKSLAIYLVRP